MSAQCFNCTPAAGNHPDPGLLELQRRLAEQGLHIRLPTAGSKWRLPELIEVEGESASEALIRLRRANQP